MPCLETPGEATRISGESLLAVMSSAPDTSAGEGSVALLSVGGWLRDILVKSLGFVSRIVESLTSILRSVLLVNANEK